MMDKLLHIVPYTAEHGQFILSCQMNHKVLEPDKHYINIEGNAKNLEQDHLSFTGLVGKKPIFAAGMSPASRNCAAAATKSFTVTFLVSVALRSARANTSVA